MKDQEQEILDLLNNCPNGRSFYGIYADVSISEDKDLDRVLKKLLEDKRIKAFGDNNSIYGII